MSSLFEVAPEKDSMPWQVKAIGLIGVPSAIACYLVYILAQDVRANQVSIKENLSLHAVQTTQMEQQSYKVVMALENLKKATDRVCANTARSTIERNECFR